MGDTHHNSGNRSAAASERPGFDKDQPTQSPGQRDNDADPSRGAAVPQFDEGESRPSPIESTTDDNVRSAPPGSKADAKGKHPTATDRETHVEATMPPGEGRDPKRNTM